MVVGEAYGRQEDLGQEAEGVEVELLILREVGVEEVEEDHRQLKGEEVVVEEEVEVFHLDLTLVVAVEVAGA